MTPHFQHSRRAVYRVVYPVRERPTFLTKGESFSVLDCSELGMRYQTPDVHRPELGTTIAGHVRFRRGIEVPVTGEVIRTENGTVALWFRAQGIPLTEIMTERRYLESTDDEVAKPA
jgi:PilZ domain-containing protein